MATEWKKIFIDLRAIKYDSARLYLRQLENTLDLTKWINEGIAEGEINALSSFTLNGLTPTTQTFATTENGTNFTISSTGSVHSFNLPIASATNTGKLSKEDWARFDAGISPTLGDLKSNSNAANIIGGTNAVIGGDVTIDFNAADGADDGILLSSDWITFSSKLGSASNGLTVTGTLVELGGALTKNTIITGNFNFEVNPYNNTLPPIFVGGSTAYVGVRTRTPATMLSSGSLITDFYDGTYYVAGDGISWVNQSGSSSYIAAFLHNGGSGHGLLARINNSSASTNIFNASSNTTSRFIVKGDGKVGIGIYTPLYKFDTLLGTSEAAYIRSTNVSFNIADNSFASGFYNLNTGATANAYHVFYVQNSNTVNDLNNRTDVVVKANGNNGVRIMSYSTAAVLGADVGINVIRGNNLYIGSESSGAVTYLGSNTGSGSSVTFSSAISLFNINKASSVTDVMSFSTGCLKLNYAGAATVGASGAASALPAQPLGYATIDVNGTNVKIPYYNV